MAPPESGAPGIFAMADPQRIVELVTGAGFGSPELVEVRMTWRFSDFDEYWRYTNEIAGAIALVLQQLDDRDRDAVRHEVERACEPLATSDGYEMPGVCINGLAS
jgi:hypothetical protein